MPLLQRLAAGPEVPSEAEPSPLPHVLLIVDGFPKALGGGERIVLRLAALLPQYGFRVSILTFAFHPESSFQLAEAPCPVYLLPLRNTYSLHAFRAALALRRFLHEQKVQLVQTFFESSDLWGGLVTRLFSSAKLVWSRRDMGILRGRKHQIAYRWLGRLPHAVFAVSARVAEHVTSVDRISPARVHVIHNGLDLQRLPAMPPRKLARSPVITTIGNVRHVKGHDLLIQAAARVHLHFPSATFTVAGDVLEPEYYKQLLEQVAALNLAEHFHFLGSVADLERHLAAADIFVLPSRSEGFSNALIEAMAFGLPVIATDVGGNAEAIHEGKSGLLTPPDDAAALAKSLLYLLHNPEVAERLSIGARQTVERHFTVKAMMQKVAERYQELLRT